MDIAERLQELRKKEGYSQEKLAEMLGISRQAISKWESGQGKPEIENIIKLTEIYKVSADYILLGEKEKVNKSMTEEKAVCNEYRKAISIIAIVGATAVITILFITFLWILAKFVF